MVRRLAKRARTRFILPIFALTGLFASASNAGIDPDHPIEALAALKGDRLDRSGLDLSGLDLSADDAKSSRVVPPSATIKLSLSEEAALKTRLDYAFGERDDEAIKRRFDEAFEPRLYGAEAAIATFKAYNDMLPYITDPKWKAALRGSRPTPEVVGAKPVKRLSTVAACRKVFGEKAYFNTALERDAEAQFGLEQGALAITARIESTNDPCAYSKDKAMGLYQIIPAKAHELQGDPFNPKIAPYMAASILANCGKLSKWLGISSEFQEAARYACYHSGEGVLDKMVKRKGDFTMAALGKWGKDYVRKHDAARGGRLLDPEKAMLASNEGLRAIEQIIRSQRIAAVGMPVFVTAYRQ